MASAVRWRYFMGAAAVVLVCGCEAEDNARLARIGRKIATRAEALAGGPDGKLAREWQALRAGWTEPAVDARVAARLQSDKKLADVNIQVTVTGSTVELHGTVQDGGQHRRALDLAETTIGVEKVTDELEGPAAE